MACAAAVATSGYSSTRLAKSSSSPESNSRSIFAVSSGTRQASLFGLAENACEPGMRVLDIEDRILRRLLLRQIEIKIEMTVVFAKQEKEPDHVGARLLR